MGHRYDEYKVCQRRGHQKSGRIHMIEGEGWELCRHCQTAFRHVTEIKEVNKPSLND